MVSHIFEYLRKRKDPIVVCNKFKLRRERITLAESLKKHLPFARIANHSELWDPPSCGDLSIYIEGCVVNIFRDI